MVQTTVNVHLTRSLVEGRRMKEGECLENWSATGILPAKEE